MSRTHDKTERLKGVAFSYFNVSGILAHSTQQQHGRERRPNCRRALFAALLAWPARGSNLWPRAYLRSAPLESTPRHVIMYYVPVKVDLILRSHHLCYLICMFGFIINVAMNFRACFHASIAFTDGASEITDHIHWLKCRGGLVLKLNALLGAKTFAEIRW